MPIWPLSSEPAASFSASMITTKLLCSSIHHALPPTIFFAACMIFTITRLRKTASDPLLTVFIHTTIIIAYPNQQTTIHTWPFPFRKPSTILNDALVIFTLSEVSTSRSGFV